MEVNENGEIETKTKKLRFIEEAFTIDTTNHCCIAPEPLGNYDFLIISGLSNGSQSYPINQIGESIVTVGRGSFIATGGYSGSSGFHACSLRVTILCNGGWSYSENATKFSFYAKDLGNSWASDVMPSSVVGIKIQ